MHFGEPRPEADEGVGEESKGLCLNGGVGRAAPDYAKRSALRWGWF